MADDKEEFEKLLNLPAGYSYEFHRIGEQQIHVYIKEVADEDAALNWIDKLQLKSQETWRISKTERDGQINSFKQFRYCQHAANKQVRGIRTSKSTGCTATLQITVHRHLPKSKSRIKDRIRKEWPTVVTYRSAHNHSISSAAVLASMDLQSSLQESGTTTLLKRAVELEKEGQFHEALISYQTGMEQLLQVLQNTRNEESKTQLRAKFNEYMGHAEAIRKLIDELKESGKYHEEIHIENNSTGHSYEQIFRCFLDNSVTEIEVEDPYVRNHNQIFNFVRFCEMLTSCATQVQRIRLKTGKDNGFESQQQQMFALNELTESLRHYNIELLVDYSNALHGREIRFNNGWIVKIGRGLDYFKAPDGKYSIGSYDLSQRKCHSTTVNIFHRKFTKGV